MSVFNWLSEAYKAWDRNPIVDPGDAGTIQVRQSGPVHLRSAGVETRTLPRPGAKGTHLFIDMETDGGDITLTVTGGYDETGDTTFTFSDPGQFLYLVSVYESVAAVYEWRKISDYGIGNAALAGLTATAAEINAVADVSGRMINTTATQVTVDAATYGDRDLVVSSTHTTTLTLPAASGSGNRYSIIRGVSGTEGSTVVNVANTTDIFVGASIAQSTESTTIGFLATSTDNTITLNRTTTGGLAGTKIELVDIATGKFFVKLWNIGTGNPATPFSHT